MAHLVARDRPVVTDTNLYPVIGVMTWLLLALTALALGFRFMTRCFLKDVVSIGAEDVLILLAFAFGIGESVTLLLPNAQVLGVSGSQISSSQALANGLKLQYASQLLFVLAIMFAKLSTCVSLLALSPVKGHRRLIWVLGGLITLYGLSALFTNAFQCTLPMPWNYITNTCVNREALNIYIGVGNIATDLGLIALPVLILYPLQMPLDKRLTIISFFVARIIAIAATVVQLSFLHKWLYSSDFTLAMFPYLITTQVVQCASISTACIAYLWPFLKSLRTGKLWAEDVAQSTMNVAGYDAYGSRGSRTTRSRPNFSSPLQSQTATRSDRQEYIEITNQSTVSSSRVTLPPEQVAESARAAEHTYQHAW